MNLKTCFGGHGFSSRVRAYTGGVVSSSKNGLAGTKPVSVERVLVGRVGEESVLDIQQAASKEDSIPGTGRLPLYKEAVRGGYCRYCGRGRNVSQFYARKCIRPQEGPYGRRDGSNLSVLF